MVYLAFTRWKFEKTSKPAQITLVYPIQERKNSVENFGLNHNLKVEMHFHGFCIYHCKPLILTLKL